ncbi:hypothetical protein WR25_16228 isoform F [Diploscapter pachys]|nr:hypothetical protein WR25_16228 isoform E [Diploscapter pachys]PAV75473.1 hypothetical protein WR25_16228 isoform F [Diploscapter pachys]
MANKLQQKSRNFQLMQVDFYLPTLNFPQVFTSPSCAPTPVQTFPNLSILSNTYCQPVAKIQDSSPPLACPAPLVAIAPQGITDWPSSAAAAFAATTLTTSPSGTQLLQTVVTPQGLSPSSRLESGPSAFSSVVPSITIHPSAVCSISLPIPSPPRVGFVSPPSVSIPTFIGSCSASTGAAPSLGASASAGVQQFSAFADVYPSLMCFPDILKQLQAAHCTPATVTTTISTSSQSTPAPPHEDVLRSHMNAATFKPIPNNEKRVDLARFRVKDPGEWLVDDVVAWMLDVAKRHSIPFEEMNMHRFASLNGQAMLMMTEQNFMEKDPVWGRLIYSEFKKCASNHEDTLIDDYMKNNPSDEDSPMRPSTSQDAPKLALLHPPAPQIQSQLQQSLNQALNQTINQALNQTLNQSLFTQHSIQTLNQSLASSLAAGLSTGLSPMSLGLLPNGLSPSSPMFNQMQPKISPQPASNEMMKYQNAPASISSSEYEESVRVHRHEPKIKKNKDGKPRKRSQHTKGNKLWEFIRDALKDPSTCPSVVR